MYQPVMLILILYICRAMGNEKNDAFLYRELRDVYEKAIREQPSSTSSYLQLADLHKDNRYYDNAVSTL